MITAIEYYRPVGIGATSPQLFRADDGLIYIVKLKNNRLGPKVLANELLGSRLGQMMGLCFPPAGIIEIEETLVKRSRRLAAARVSPGKHFACQYLSNSSYLCESNLHKAVNKAEMAGVMLFDHMLHNADRTMNRRNLLLRREEGGHKIYAIDNSHLFRGALWTERRLNKLAERIRINERRSYGILLRRFLRPAHFSPYLAKVNELSDEVLQGLVEELPQEWLPQQEERVALTRFLIKRRDLAEAIVNSLCGLIPYKHRSTDID